MDATIQNGIALNPKSILTKVDTTPTADSNNPVSSDGVKTYVDQKDQATNIRVDTLNTQIAASFFFKGSSTFAELPASGNTVNDTYYVTDSDKECWYSWNGTDWIKSSMSQADYAGLIAQLKADISAEYSTSKTYKVGDYCLYGADGVLYICKIAVTTAGAFDSNKWQAISFGEAVGDLVIADDTQPTSLANKIWLDTDPNLDTVEVITEEDLGNIVAGEFDSASAYAVGDYCIHDAKLYVAKTATAANDGWIAARWQQVTVMGTINDQVGELKTQIDDLGTTQTKTVFSGDISGTTSKTFPVNLPAGKYYIHIDNVESSDTDFTKSRISFYYDQSNYQGIDLDRGIQIDKTINLTHDTINIVFYAAATNYAGNVGKTFTYSGLRIYADTPLGLRLVNLENRAEALTTYTGNDEIQFVSGYIDTSGATADVTDIRSDAGYRCAVVECSHGDEFVVSVKGATAGRAFAFVAEDGTVLFNAAQNTTTEDRLLVAPEGAKWLVLNDNNTGKKSYINNLLVNIVKKTRNELNDIGEKQQFVLLSETVSGTRSITIPLAFPAGTYHIHCDSVDSSDISGQAYSRIVFSDGTQNGKTVDITRAGYDAYITFANDVRQFTCYGKSNYNDSANIVFSYNNLTIAKDTILNKRLTALETKTKKINPYQNVIFSVDHPVKTTTHVHCGQQAVFNRLAAKNLGLYAISNYYPSNAYSAYPVSEHFSGAEDALSIPNAEHHSATNLSGSYHLNAVGSTFSSGKPSGQTPVGLNDTWEHSIKKMKRELLIPDGGGVTINHPIWSHLTYEQVIKVLDYDECVLGIEIYAGEGADDVLGDALALWDKILMSGRRCWGFAVPDHLAESMDDWPGTITLFVPEETQEACLKAIREGSFYAQIHHTSLALTDFVYSEKEYTGGVRNIVSVAVSESAEIKAVIDGSVYSTTTGTSAEITVPDGAGYIRFEISTANDKIFTNPLMFGGLKA